jgi:hypothetical protein
MERAPDPDRVKDVLLAALELWHMSPVPPR